MRLFLLLFFSFFSIGTFAQQPVLHWARAFASQNTTNYSPASNGRSVAVDQQGNVYSAGLFQYTVDFDPGPGTYTLKGSAGYSETGIYISKLDVNGNFVWAVQLPVLVSFDNIEIKVDKNDNVYLASAFTSPADMDPGLGVKILTPIGWRDAFVIKLDPNGNFVWVKQFGGPGDSGSNSNNLDIDKDNNVIICGGFNNTIDFDPGPGTFNLTSTAHIQSYITKLNSNGDFIWAKQFGNSPVVYSGANIADVKCDPGGNIFLVGMFSGSCDFDPGTGVYTLAAGSLRDGFISRLDANGNFVWAKKITNTTNDYYHFITSRGLDIDSKNNIITNGDFFGTVDFDPGARVYSLLSNGFSDSYILKLNEYGEFLWAKAIGGTDHETGNDVVVDSDNNVYAAGSYGKSVDFDPGPGQFILTSPNFDASVLVKLNPDGNFIYAVPFPGIANYGGSLLRRMAIDASKNVYIAGHVSGVVDFDPSANIYPVTGSSSSSPLVLKLGKCNNITAATLNINTCTTYTLNNEIFDSSGTYIRTLANASGCDSVITLNLTINKKFTQQTIAICEGDFFFAGGANQGTSGTYIDTLKTFQGCDSIITTYLTVNPKPLPNLGVDKDLCSNTQLTISPGSFSSYLWQDMSTANSFTINDVGVYWVKVTNNFNCTATDTFNVNAMLPSPANFLKQTDSICAYQSLDVLSTNIYTKYQWSTGEVFRKITVQKPGMYWLKVTDANECFGTDTITVFSKQCMSGAYIPNAFSPDGDGKNDYFRPMLFGNVKLYEFTVFNQWGEIVFKTNDVNKKWNGSYKGVLQDPNIFVWTCKYQFENEPVELEKGSVMLVR